MKTDARSDFYSLADDVLSMRKGGEEMLLSFDGEHSDFVRFNNALIRQPGTVEQGYLTVELIIGKKHSSARASLSGDPALDASRLKEVVERLRSEIVTLPEDPYLILPEDPRSSEQIGEDRLPGARHTVKEILDAVSGTDFVGLYSAGGVFRGFASSLGQRSWFSNYSFHADFSLYAHEDKAIKESLAGEEWDSKKLRCKVMEAKEMLAVLNEPVRDISPGRYRVFLSPAALAEIVSTLSWAGFGLRSHRSKTTSLLGLIQGESSLSPMVTLRENTRGGVGPSFDDAGFVKPDMVELIDEGRLVGALVSPRSAVEYGVPTNAASAGEQPQSIDMDAGEIPRAEVLERLQNGIYVGNLHYLNYSDLRSCRMTGMTRFGTFWVEGGRIIAPTPAMRFDESLYRMLGENLEGLTSERELLLDASTYFVRSTESARLPGALVRDFTLTL